MLLTLKFKINAVNDLHNLLPGELYLRTLNNENK